MKQENGIQVHKPLVRHQASGGLWQDLWKDLQRLWSPWRNYFEPVMRLEVKTRPRSNFHRRNELAATP